MEATEPTPRRPYSFKLACPRCGAIVRTTDFGLRLSGGIVCSRDKVKLAPASPRSYIARRMAVANA